MPQTPPGNADGFIPARTPMLAASAARRAFWRRTLHQWHWISAALSLAGMMLFAATGLLLNNAALLESEPEVHTRALTLPDPILADLQAAAAALTPSAPTLLPDAVRPWLAAELDIHISDQTAEISGANVTLSLAQPGADAWLTIDLDSGAVEYERSDYGWIAYFNDLHKGRHTGRVWSWFIDVFAIACLIFTTSGLFLLFMHARQRQSTWPLTTLGLIVPLILMLLFIH